MKTTTKKECIWASIGLVVGFVVVGLFALFTASREYQVYKLARNRNVDGLLQVAINADRETRDTSEIRVWAIETLGWIGDVNAIEPLTACLRSDEDSSVVTAVEKVLIDFGEPTVAPLIRAINGPLQNIVHPVAIRTLGRIGGVRAIDPLIALNRAIQDRHNTFGSGRPAKDWYREKAIDEVLSQFDDERIVKAYYVDRHKPRCSYIPEAAIEGLNSRFEVLAQVPSGVGCSDAPKYNGEDHSRFHPLAIIRTNGRLHPWIFRMPATWFGVSTDVKSIELVLIVGRPQEQVDDSKLVVVYPRDGRPSTTHDYKYLAIPLTLREAATGRIVASTAIRTHKNNVVQSGRFFPILAERYSEHCFEYKCEQSAFPHAWLRRYVE